MKIDVIITEKPRMSSAIAKAFIPSSETIEKYQHIDIFRIKKSKNKTENKLNSFHYITSGSRPAFSIEILHKDAQGQHHVEKVRRRLRQESKLKREFGERNSDVIEEISYYFIPYQNRGILICDTQGNPLTYSGDTRSDLVKLITLASDWNDLSKQLSLRPAFEPNSFGDGTAHVARSLWFEFALARHKLPCSIKDMNMGDDFFLGRVIAATDEDVAGAYIFLSLIEFINQIAKKEHLENIPEKKLNRLDISSIESTAIRASFENPRKFDWNLALAGKSRAEFDFVFGSTLTRWFTNINRQIHSEKKISHKRISIGRNRSLGLRELIGLSERAKLNQPKRYLYLVFPNLLGWDEINTHFQNKNYTVLQISTLQNRVTPASLLIACREKGIGTHTTRYKIPKQLVQMGVAELKASDELINSTVYGQEYNRLFTPLLDFDNATGLSNWNILLNNQLKAAKDIERPMAEIAYQNFINMFFPVFQKYLVKLQNQTETLENILRELGNINFKKAIEVNTPNSLNTNDVGIASALDGNHLFLNGLDVCIPIPEVEAL